MHPRLRRSRRLRGAQFEQWQLAVGRQIIHHQRHQRFPGHPQWIDCKKYRRRRLEPMTMRSCGKRFVAYSPSLIARR